MDLTQSAWMVRDLGQAVSALHICEDYSIIAGGWDGKLSHWDSEGKLIWSMDCEDRIESIMPLDDKVIVTSGLHIVCVKNGNQIWSHALEGSADLLVNHEGQIIASSSVYDIEHEDFMESGIWKFDIEGNLIEVERIDERPWFMCSSNELIIGLGRPKCGILVDGEHVDPDINSPVTCGVNGRENLLLGHADGTILLYPDKQLTREESSIESIVCADYGFVSALENGNLVARKPNSELIWESKTDQIITQCVGFSSIHWAGTWNEIEGSIEIRSQGGELIGSQKYPKPRVSMSYQERVGFGFEDGQIIVWEKDLFDRRKSQEKVEVDERKSALAARLRSLRK